MTNLPETKNSVESRRSAYAIPLPNGLTFHLTSREMLYSAKYLFKEIFVQRRYYRQGFEIRPDDTVVDIGANMGMFVMWSAPQACRGRVIAIEPAQGTFDCLQFNVEANGLQNVVALRQAVGNRGERLELIEYPGLNLVSHEASFPLPLATRLWNYRRKKSAIRTTAPCVCLEDVMEEHHLEFIHYLKIDCEGGEYTILRSLPSRCWERIERIALEFHELNSDQNHRELVSCLQKHGFEVQVRKSFLNYHCFKAGEIWGRRPTPDG